MAPVTTKTKQDGESAASEQARVKCLACDMIQFESDFCRRCKHKLPKPIVREVVKEVKTFVTIDVALFGPKAPVLLMDEYERRVIIHALKRCKSAVAAARALGIGKTTLYRKLAEYKIDAAGYLKYAKRGQKPIR